MTLQTLIDSWVTSDPSRTWKPPATESEIRAVEEKIGYTLPSSLRELYRFSNGDENVDKVPGVVFFSLLWLTEANENFIEWGWHIPQEVQMFAGDGGDDHFAIWLPETNSEVFNHPIIEVGEIFGPGCMGVVGTNLTSFLLGRTVWSLLFEIYYLKDSEEPDARDKLKQVHTALDMLQVPQRFRRVDPFGEDNERQFLQIIKWADPLLPDSLLASYGSYEQEYTVTDLKKLFGEP